MEIHILTIFPEMFVSPLRASILQRAQERGRLQVTVHDIREFASGDAIGSPTTARTAAARAW